MEATDQLVLMLVCLLLIEMFGFILHFSTREAAKIGMSRFRDLSG